MLKSSVLCSMCIDNSIFFHPINVFGALSKNTFLSKNNVNFSLSKKSPTHAEAQRTKNNI